VKFDYKPYLSLTGATVLGQGLVLLVTPAVTRLYSQEQFGAFGLLLGAGAILASVSSGRLELAIPAALTSLTASRLFVVGVVGVFCSTAMAAMTISVLRFFDLVPKNVWNELPLTAIALICFALGLFQLSGALILWHKRYWDFSVSKIAQGSTTAFFQVVLGLLSFSSTGLIFAQFIGYFLASGAGLKTLLPEVKKEINVNGTAWSKVLREHAQYPLIMVPAAAFNQASLQLPLFAITHMFSLSEAGLFLFVTRVCTAPLGLISQSVSQVYASQFREVAASGSGKVTSHLVKLIFGLLTFGLVTVVALVASLLFADHIHFFGPNWPRLGVVGLYLSPVFLFDFVVGPISTTLSYVGKQKIQLAWDIGRFLAVAATFIVAGALQLSFENTLVLHSVVWSSALIVHLLISYRASKNLESVNSEGNR
jgi:O-antigen/teichoic acid export membrane protein